MQTLRLKLAIFLVLSFFIGLAQPNKNDKSSMQNNNPFSKGNWSFTNRSMISYNQYNSKNSQALNTGTRNDFTLLADPSYFFTNHFAIGIDARVSSNNYLTGVESKIHSWRADLTLTYGTQINNKLNVYAKIAAGPGHSWSSFNATTDLLGAATINTYKTFDIRGTIGLPIALQQNGFTFFTPYLSYDHFSYKSEKIELPEKSFLIGFKLESYLHCNADGAHALNLDRYNKGNGFLEFNTMGNFTIDKIDQIQGGRLIVHYKTTSGSLSAGYHYYFMNNLAAGINLKFGTSTRDNGSTQKSNNFSLQPVITANAPLQGSLQNLFLQAAYSFGNNNITGLKSNVNDVTIMAGYNYFITKNVSLTPKAGWQQLTTKSHFSSGISTLKESGFTAEMGARVWLRL